MPRRATNSTSQKGGIDTMTTTTQTREPGSNVLDRNETHQLIASDKVEGTSVFDRQGEKLGTVRKVMIGKRDGRAHYVVMGFGGLFGMGEDNYPLPWDALDYDTKLGGYKMKSLSKNDLDKEKAPSYGRNEEPSWSEDYDRKIRLYYIRTA
jgi:sporulation protein YlmC with PRC-barrel domain